VYKDRTCDAILYVVYNYVTVWHGLVWFGVQFRGDSKGAAPIQTSGPPVALPKCSVTNGCIV